MESIKKYFSSERYAVWFWLFWGVLALVWIGVLERVDLSSMDKFLVYGLVMVTFMCIGGGRIFAARKSSQTKSEDA
jgi:hypothetical protein